MGDADRIASADVMGPSASVEPPMDELLPDWRARRDKPNATLSLPKCGVRMRRRTMPSDDELRLCA